MAIRSFVKSLFKSHDREEQAENSIDMDNVSFEILDIYKSKKCTDTISPASLCHFESNSKQYYRPSLCISNSKRTSIRRSGISTASGTSFGIKSALSNSNSIKSTNVIQLKGDETDDIMMDQAKNEFKESSLQNTMNEESKHAYCTPTIQYIYIKPLMSRVMKRRWIYHMTYSLQ